LADTPRTGSKEMETHIAATHDRPSLLTLPEAAQVLAISLTQVRRFVRSGQLPAVRLARSIRIDPQELEKFIMSNTRAGDEKCL
jgi:excisionase family DNA binding protein